MFVVLSDMHFGLDSCTLKDGALVDRLVDELAALKPEEVILLGDVFEFWDCDPEVAIENSRYFFERLSGLRSKIVYVIGNHDHHLKALDWELNRFGSRLPELPYQLKSPFFTSLLSGKKIEVHYHEYSKNIGGKDFLFTHGHYFIGENSLVPGALRRLGVLRRDIHRSVEAYKQSGGEKELEGVLTGAYETLYWSTFIGGLKGSLSGVWYEIEHLFTHIFGREPLESYFKDTYLDVVRYLKGRKFDYVVFGHSHRAGVYSEPPEPLTLVNTGAWCTAGVYEQDAVNCYAIIDGADVKIRRL